MGEIVKKLPVPIVGLMLALAATGNLVLSYGSIYRNIFGILAGVILILMLVKFVLYPKGVSKALDNPVVLSVFPTFSMGIMLLATYLKPLSFSVGYSVWIIGLLLHGILIIYFTKKHIFSYSIKKVFPSWFIVYVGIVVGSVTAPAFDMINVGQALFWFGFISYLLLLPIVIKRVFSVKEMPEPTLPTLVIFSAPASLCLAGYMSSFQDKNMFIVWTLVALSQFTLVCVLFKLPSLLKLKFYPSYSAFTFPIVISAISIKLTNGFLMNTGKSIPLLKYVIKFEELLAVGIVIYVLIRYIGSLLSNPETAK